MVARDEGSARKTGQPGAALMTVYPIIRRSASAPGRRTPDAGPDLAHPDANSAKSGGQGIGALTSFLDVSSLNWPGDSHPSAFFRGMRP